MRRRRAEIGEDEPETFVPASVSENPYKSFRWCWWDWLREYHVKVKTEKEQIKKEYSCVQEQVENLRQNSSEAVTIGRRNGSGKITINYSNELVTTLGGSLASETLSYGSSTTYFNDNINADDIFDHPSSSNSNSLFS